MGLLALPLAFGLHALVDFDLDFLAIVVPTALVSAALLAAGRPAAVARSRGLVAVGASLVAVAAVWVIASPALSSRAVDRAYRQSDAGDLVGGGRLGSAGAEPQPALARAALRPRHDRVARGRQSALPRRSTSRQRGYSPRTPRPGTSSVSFARPRSATSAAPTSPSTPRSRSIRRAASSSRAGRSTRRGMR